MHFNCKTQLNFVVTRLNCFIYLPIQFDLICILFIGKPDKPGYHVDHVKQTQ